MTRNEMLQKIEMIMQLSKNETKEIRQSARNRSINSKYSYWDRSVYVKNVIEDNF